jgi:alkylation response protein AidB-like acyl-CoA dehydrogenase
VIHPKNMQLQQEHVLRQTAEAIGARTRSGYGREELLSIHRKLGRDGLLAPHWPSRLGGLGASFSASACVVEQLVLAGYSDTLIVNSVYNAGHALRWDGREVWSDLLRRIAAGTCFVAVLFTEPDAGSDMANVRSLATRCEDGWCLSGHKAWIAQADICDYGICVARTSGASGEAGGLSLFMLRMSQPGIALSESDAHWVEPLFDVVIDNVVVSSGSLIGTEGAAWEVLSGLLSMERASMGYWARGERWFEGVKDLASDRYLTLRHQLDVARALSWRAVSQIEAGTCESCGPAMAKYRSATVAMEIAQAAVLEGFVGSDEWLTEAVGLTIAAGTSEMMLRTLVPFLGDITEETGW